MVMVTRSQASTMDSYSDSREPPNNEDTTAQHGLPEMSHGEAAEMRSRIDGLDNKMDNMTRMMEALLRANTQSLAGSDPHPSIPGVPGAAGPGGENSQQNPVHGECSNHEQTRSLSSVPVEVRLDPACSGPVEDQREVSSWRSHAALVLGECSNQGPSRCHPGVPVEVRSGPTQSGPVEDQMGSPRGTSQPILVHGECSNHGSSRCHPGVPVEARSGPTQSGPVEDQMGNPRGTSQPKAPSQLGETDHCNSVHQEATQPRLGEYSQVAFPYTINLAKNLPNPFSGDRNKALSWITEYENAMEAFGHSNAVKLRQARAFMTDVARAWYVIVTSCRKRGISKYAPTHNAQLITSKLSCTVKLIHAI